MKPEFVKALAQSADTKLLFVVIDGLGGLPHPPEGKTELEAATTPNLDRLARDGICGLHIPVRSAVTPGSGPAHLGLFGYDPVEYQVGRGVLSALGVGFDLRPEDVASRGNFCTIDGEGKITDRRAGRIPTETGKKMCDILSGISISGVEVFVQPVKEYRFLLVLRGDGLSGAVADTDPQHTGKAPLAANPLSKNAKKTAKIVDEFAAQAKKLLADQHPANMVLLRGFSMRPTWPLLPDIYGVRAAAIATYPMYRGVARLVGMEVLSTGETVEDEIETLQSHWNDYDFFYFHVKKTDSAGEDGDFDRKVSVLEEFDKLVPRLTELKPDVVVVTGDHSTPSVLASHSWHPVPILLWSKFCRTDMVQSFGERSCLAGGLSPRLPSYEIMPLAMANALRIEKFGA
jgi:2,3-bisphosphoglycerate-independent phosphoglycerate mutase